ncbi:hypothetical protein D3C71_977810 [compost metagenome]
MRIRVSVLGIAKKPFSSGSVGPAALSGRDAAVDGSATESRCGRMAWPMPGTCAWAVNEAGGAAGRSVVPGTTGAAIRAWVGGGFPDSIACRRCSICSSVCRSVWISCRNAAAESCAYTGAAANAATHATVNTAKRITSSLNRTQSRGSTPADVQNAAGGEHAARHCNARDLCRRVGRWRSRHRTHRLHGYARTGSPHP